MNKQVDYSIFLEMYLSEDFGEKYFKKEYKKIGLDFENLDNDRKSHKDKKYSSICITNKKIFSNILQSYV